MLRTVDQQTGEITETRPLTESERANLARYEADYDKGIMQAWLALKGVHDEKLYREYGTFEDYCQQKRGFSRQRAQQLMDAFDLAQEMSTSGLQTYLTNERICRALMDVEPAERVAVLTGAVQASGGDVDSGWIKDSAKVRSEMRATGGLVDDGEGSMTNATAAVIEERHERLLRKRQHIKDSIDAKRADDGLSKVFEGYVSYHSHNKVTSTLTAFLPRETLAHFDGAKPGKTLWIVVYEVSEDIEQ